MTESLSKNYWPLLAINPVIYYGTALCCGLTTGLAFMGDFRDLTFFSTPAGTALLLILGATLLYYGARVNAGIAKEAVEPSLPESDNAKVNAGFGDWVFQTQLWADYLKQEYDDIQLKNLSLLRKILLATGLLAAACSGAIVFGQLMDVSQHITIPALAQWAGLQPTMMVLGAVGAVGTSVVVGKIMAKLAYDPTPWKTCTDFFKNMFKRSENKSGRKAVIAFMLIVIGITGLVFSTLTGADGVINMFHSAPLAYALLVGTLMAEIAFVVKAAFKAAEVATKTEKEGEKPAPHALKGWQKFLIFVFFPLFELLYLLENLFIIPKNANSFFGRAETFLHTRIQGLLNAIGIGCMAFIEQHGALKWLALGTGFLLSFTSSCVDDAEEPAPADAPVIAGHGDQPPTAASSNHTDTSGDQDGSEIQMNSLNR